MFPAVTTIKIEDKTLEVPALSLGQLRNGMLALLQKHDELLASDKTFEAMEIRGKVILQAVQRNYPDFDETELFDYLDLANTGAIWLAILGASGFTPGEVKAANVAEPGT